MSELLPSQTESDIRWQGQVGTQTFDLTSLSPPKRHFWTRGFATQLTIDGSGIRVEDSQSKPRTLLWVDPDLEFFLVDYRAPAARNDRWATPAQAKRTPFKFFPGPWNRPSAASYVWVTEAAYDALYRAGFAARLHVCHGAGRSYASDAIVTIFRRKPHRFGYIRELNPNAEP